MKKVVTTVIIVIFEKVDIKGYTGIACFGVPAKSGDFVGKRRTKGIKRSFRIYPETECVLPLV